MKPPCRGLRLRVRDGDTGSMDEMTIQRKAPPRLSAEQRETLERGLRILARAIVRAHLRRQGSRSAASPRPEGQDRLGKTAPISQEDD